ncbi:hypothetical protein WR25_04728 [Diploscapter pachys]|uniref:Phospholipid/glycerol acyltransferase domain-containing protein n=1 Tax=Diploscapter pachys TaxID=2018661 RepID=A0A2A2L6H6_9BILA|nr:hypothetical protein WR25_04728 [Diploscapter pachys]
MSSPGEPPILKEQPLSIRVRGWLFAAFIFFSALFGIAVIVTPLLPLIFVNPKLWRKILDRLVGLWICMPAAMMSVIFGSRTHVRGDRIDHADAAIIIMNHRTRLDWLFFWDALFKIDPWLLTTEKISLKGILKYVPGAGWAMQANAFIFLDRSFATDAGRLDTILDYFINIGYNYQILLYPEGTDKCPKATERSRIYAEKKGLVHYDYVLHPRTTGFVHIVKKLREADYVKYLYDVTVGFGDAIVQSEVDLIENGASPKEIHYQIRKIPISDLPQDDEALSQWLITLWAEKEEKLRRFYSMDPVRRKFDQTRNGHDYELEQRDYILQIAIIGLWVVTTFFWISAFFEVSFMFYFIILACIIYLCIQKFYGGLEFFVIEKFNEHRARQRGQSVPLSVPSEPSPVESSNSNDM